MEASSGRSRLRPIVVDCLATLFVTFCIGVGTALVLGACVVLMAAEARGAPGAPLAPMQASEARQGALLLRRDSASETYCARIVELALAHQLVTKYTSLIAIDRAPARRGRLRDTVTQRRRPPKLPRSRVGP